MPIATFRRTAVAAALAFAGSPAGADVYVAQQSSTVPPAILVFASDAVGDTPPIRVIAGDATGLGSMDGLFIDDVHGELYVSDCYESRILVFALNAEGNAPPLRTFSHADGAFHCLRQVVVDTQHDEVLVPSFELFASSVSVFPRLANGPTAPLREWSSTTLGALDNPFNIAFVPSADEFIVNSYGAGSPGLLAFARAAAGAPIRTLAGPATLLSGYSNYLALDRGNDELYADAYGCGNTCIAVFPRAASGDTPPTRYLVRPNRIDDSVRGLAYDAVGERLHVLAGDSLYHEPFGVQTVQVYERTAQGEAPAVVAIGGPDSQIRDPQAVAIDAGGGFFGNGPRSYRSAAAFDAAVATPAALTAEDFEGGSVTPGHARVCAEPVAAASSDACFTPGQIAAGVVLRSSSGKGVGLYGAGFYDNPTDALGALFSGDATHLEFPHGTTAVAFEVRLDATVVQGGATVAVYGEGARALSYSRVEPAAGAADFIGFTSAVPLRRVELRSVTGNGVVLVDNLRFRAASDAIFADAFETVP